MKFPQWDETPGWCSLCNVAFNSYQVHSKSVRDHACIEMCLLASLTDPSRTWVSPAAVYASCGSHREALHGCFGQLAASRYQMIFHSLNELHTSAGLFPVLASGTRDHTTIWRSTYRGYTGIYYYISRPTVMMFPGCSAFELSQFHRNVTEPRYLETLYHVGAFADLAIHPKGVVYWPKGCGPTTIHYKATFIRRIFGELMDTKVASLSPRHAALRHFAMAGIISEIILCGVTDFVFRANVVRNRLIEEGLIQIPPVKNEPPPLMGPALFNTLHFERISRTWPKYEFDMWAVCLARLEVGTLVTVSWTSGEKTTARVVKVETTHKRLFVQCSGVGGAVRQIPSEDVVHVEPGGVEVKDEMFSFKKGGTKGRRGRGVFGLVPKDYENANFDNRKPSVVPLKPKKDLARKKAKDRLKKDKAMHRLTSPFVRSPSE